MSKILPLTVVGRHCTVLCIGRAVCHLQPASKLYMHSVKPRLRHSMSGDRRNFPLNASASLVS